MFDPCLKETDRQRGDVLSTSRKRVGKFTFLTLHCEQEGRDGGMRRILKRQETPENNKRMRRSEERQIQRHNGREKGSENE